MRSKPASGGSPTSWSASLVALALALGAAFAMVVVGAAPALAHVILVDSTPADGDSLTTAPTKVVLEFDQPVSTSFTTVVVTGPSRANVVSGKPTALGATVTAPLSGGLASGAYRIAYRVVSDDGHPITGEVFFRLALPAASRAGTASRSSTPSSTPSVAAPPPAAPSDAAGGSPTGHEPGGIGRYMSPITGAALLLLVGIAGLVWERRRA